MSQFYVEKKTHLKHMLSSFNSFVFVAVEMEPWSSHILSKCCTTRQYSQSILTIYLEAGSH